MKLSDSFPVKNELYLCESELKTKAKSLSEILSKVTPIESTQMFQHCHYEITHERKTIFPYASRLSYCPSY